MRSTLHTAGVALMICGVAACGSSSSSSTTSKAASSAKRARPARIYRVALSGAAAKPPGAPVGRGVAVIAVHGRSEVCWRFAHLHGFTNATVADIQAGGTGTSGKVVVPLSTGSRLHHKGCVPVTAPLVKAIERRPDRYYVSIQSARYPHGAVRGQL